MLLVLSVFGFMLPNTVSAQCDWDISIINVINPNCENDGSFSVQITGADASLITGAIYSISASTNGYAPSAGNSPDFTSAPKGTHTVNVAALCNGNSESKSVNVILTSDYVKPEFELELYRNSLSCETGIGYGKVNLKNIQGNRYPLTITLTAKPAGYTGPAIFTLTSKPVGNYFISGLISGNYSIQIADDCGHHTINRNITIKQLNINDITTVLAKAWITGNPTGYIGDCSVIQAGSPNFDLSKPDVSDWKNFDDGDDLITWSAQFVGEPGTLVSNIPLRPSVLAQGVVMTIPNGKTIKDLYGQTDFLEYSIKPPCGAQISLPNWGVYSYTANPIMLSTITTNIPCDKTGFYATFSTAAGTFMCYPIKIKIENAALGVSETVTLLEPKSTATSNLLLFNENNSGKYNYKLTYVSADGDETTEKTISVRAPDPNPFKFSLSVQAYGLHNRLENISLTRGNNENFLPGMTVELLDTLSAVGKGYIMNITTIRSNVAFYGANSSSSPNYYQFEPGNYRLKITDECADEYFLDVVVEDKDVYKYSPITIDSVWTCQGMEIKPTGTYEYNNQPAKPAYYKITHKDGVVQHSSTIISSGEKFLLQNSGEYRIQAGGSPSILGVFKDEHSMPEYVDYKQPKIGLDGTVSQGFICIGANDNEGQISLKAAGGGTPYTYTLYATKSDADAQINSISSNSLGDFPGLMRNAEYWVRIGDACSSLTESILFKIIDLKTSQLLRANKTKFCEGETLELLAIALPNPTYTWTGPNGFTSNIANPVLHNLTKANEGKYTVTITTPYCGTPSTSDIDIYVNGRATDANIIIQDFTVCMGDQATITPASDTIANPTFVFYESQTSTTPLGAGTSFKTPVLNSDTTYYIAVYGDNACENEINKRKAVKITVDACIQAKDDHVKVFACESVDIDVIANDLIWGGNSGITVSPATITTSDGTATYNGTEYTYVNTACVGGIIDTFSYKLCKGSCSQAKVYVNVLYVPEISLNEECSFSPQLILDYQYAATYQWQYSDDNGVTWHNVTSSNKPTLDLTTVVDKRQYKVKIDFDGAKVETKVKTLNVINKLKVPGDQKFGCHLMYNPNLRLKLPLYNKIRNYRSIICFHRYFV